MAPKRGHSPTKEEETPAKRVKASDAQVSRSATPAEALGRVPFSVTYPGTKPKKKHVKKEQEEQAEIAELQVSPFVARTPGKAGTLDIPYAVVPSDEWTRLKKYNNFIIQNDVYRNNDFVFVRREGTPQYDDEDGDPRDFWIARILQVRAKDNQHVYALAAWMYWPDDLLPPKTKAVDQVSRDSGRRTYHGSHELIASNAMDVLDVLSFAGKADVDHWKEDDEGPKQELYWRQTYNHIKHELSENRRHCICNGHYNYDVPMFVCDNPDCKLWLHKSCLLDHILQKAYDARLDEGKAVLKGALSVLKGVLSNGHTNKKSTTKSPKTYEGKLKGTIEDNGELNSQVKIVDMRPGHKKSWTESIHCPKCDTVIQ